LHLEPYLMAGIETIEHGLHLKDLTTD
jgi:hypothetical protein